MAARRVLQGGSLRAWAGQVETLAPDPALGGAALLLLPATATLSALPGRDLLSAGATLTPRGYHFIGPEGGSVQPEREALLFAALACAVAGCSL